MQSTHSQLSPLRPVLLYIITIRCFSSHFLLFLFLFGRSCGRQNSSYSSIYRNTSPLPARRPTNPFACRPRTLLRSAMRRHSASARFSRPVRAPSAKSAAAFAAELPFDAPPDAFGSLYSRKRCRGAHLFAFSFHVEHTSCHSPKPQRLSRFLLVYAYLYIASLHVFRLCVCFFRPCVPFPVAAPRLAIAPRRRSRTPGSASRRVARVPSHRFAFAFSFRDRVSRPHFLDLFSSHSCDRRDVRSFACTFL